MPCDDVAVFSPDSYTKLVVRLNKSNNSRALKHPQASELLFKKGKLEGGEIDKLNAPHPFLTPQPRSAHRCNPAPPCFPPPGARSVLLPGCPMPVIVGRPIPIPPGCPIPDGPQIACCPSPSCCGRCPCGSPQQTSMPEEQFKMMAKLKDTRTRDISDLPPGYANALDNPPVNTVEGIEAINRRVQQIKDMLDLMKMEKQKKSMKSCAGCCCCCCCSEFPDLLETVNDNIVTTITNCK